MAMQFDPTIHAKRVNSEVGELRNILQRLHQKIDCDPLVQKTVDTLRHDLQVDRVLIYHFYGQWEGHVAVESLSDPNLSILGSIGPNDCFNDEYAALYLAGRVRAIADIETESMHPCHRDFLRHLHVRANLVVPILTNQGLWGLLVAHHCQSSHLWAENDSVQMLAAATVLANASSLTDP
jgi:GAF domain-containing protein